MLLLSKLHSLPLKQITVNAAFHKYKYATIKGIRYECTTKKKLSVALAKWNDQLFGPSPSSLTCTRLVNPEDAMLRPVKIGYFVKVSYTIYLALCV